MKKNGKMTAASAVFRMQGGAFPGMAPTGMALECAFANYQLPAVHHTGYDVLANRPKSAAYRAPGSPMAAFAVESLVDEMCRELKLDPIEVRLLNGSREAAGGEPGIRTTVTAASGGLERQCGLARLVWKRQCGQ